MAKAGNGHGGKRAGAGRPQGSRNRRSDALAEELIAEGRCPVRALIRLAEQSEKEGEITQAIGAWKSILPFVYPKPKAVEFAPEELVELSRNIAAARADASRELIPESLAARTERAMQKLDEMERKE